eukprot:6365792-Pyramimonas_sp.AAC.1
MGMPPSQVLLLRRQAARTVSGNSKGKCLTTVLQAVLGDGDPALEVRRQLVDSWLQLWKRFPALQPRIR